MKILHMFNGSGIGGIQVMVDSLVKVQATNSETEPAILSSKFNEFNGRKFATVGVDLHRIKLRSGYDISPIAAYRISKLFRQFDILHFHYFNAMYAICAILSGTPTVYTFHGTFGILRRKTVKDHIKRLIVKIFVRFFIDVVTYNSGFTKKYAEQMYAIRNPNTMIIYNGLSIEGISGHANHLPEAIRSKLSNKFVVGACGRLVEIKRIDRLINAFATFQHEKSDVALIIVGDGPLRDTLEGQIRELGLCDCAMIVGFQSNVFDYMAVFDVCAIPSSGEAFGLVALEALALGKPAIVFEDGGGLVEIVQDCAPEDIVPNEDGLTKRLEAYYKNRQYESGNFNRRRTYAKRFHIDASAKEFVQAYHKAGYLSREP